MIAALLAALIQGNMAPTFSEVPDPAPAKAVSQPATSAVQPVKVVADKDDPVICHEMQVTGTRFAQKQRLHKSTWEQQFRDGQDTYNAWGQGGAINHGR